MSLPNKIIEVINILNDPTPKKYELYERFKSEFPDFEFWSSAKQNLQTLTLVYSCTNDQIQECVNLLNGKYQKRDLLLFWLNLAIDQSDLNQIDNIIEQLEEDQRFLGFRKKLRYYLNQSDLDGFLDCYKKINKRQSLLPETINVIDEMIEVISHKMDISETKAFLVKKKMYSPKQVQDKLASILVGQIGKISLDNLLASAWREFDKDAILYENFIQKLSNRLNDKRKQEKLLEHWFEFAKNLDNDWKITGSPLKLKDEALWRVGKKYVELDNIEKAQMVTKELGRSKTAKSLAELINAHNNV